MASHSFSREMVFDFKMTREQARRLEKGDRVRWIGDDEATGLVTEINRFGVEISWSDGVTTRPLFNDMTRIELIAQDNSAVVC
ncbi:hypothetical protein [Bradyrhizobium genosp. P]|uniref:hypothetical protein n=1 Tax=Bradyrhizobium genosp. P TaxID=83641 RepID=UPI003CE7B7CA